MAGLEDGILHEGEPGFLSRLDAQFVLGEDLDVVGSQQFAELLELALVTAGEQDLAHRGSSVGKQGLGKADRHGQLAGVTQYPNGKDQRIVLTEVEVRQRSEEY